MIHTMASEDDFENNHNDHNIQRSVSEWLENLQNEDDVTEKKERSDLRLLGGSQTTRTASIGPPMKRTGPRTKRPTNTPQGRKENKNSTPQNEGQVQRKSPRTKHPNKQSVITDTSSADDEARKTSRRVINKNKYSITMYDSDDTKSVTSLATNEISKSTRRGQKKKLESTRENVNEGIIQDVQMMIIPGIMYVRYLLWNMPFITVLNCIMENNQTFMDIIQTMIPETNPKPQLNQNKSRTGRYWIMEEAIGNSLVTLGRLFGIRLGKSRTYVGKKETYKKAKNELQQQYEQGKSLLKKMRNAINNSPSIFWHLPPI